MNERHGMTNGMRPKRPLLAALLTGSLLLARRRPPRAPTRQGRRGAAHAAPSSPSCRTTCASSGSSSSRCCRPSSSATTCCCTCCRARAAARRLPGLSAAATPAPSRAAGRGGAEKPAGTRRRRARPSVAPGSIEGKVSHRRGLVRRGLRLRRERQDAGQEPQDLRDQAGGPAVPPARGRRADRHEPGVPQPRRRLPQRLLEFAAQHASTSAPTRRATSRARWW